MLLSPAKKAGPNSYDEENGKGQPGPGQLGAGDPGDGRARCQGFKASSVPTLAFGSCRPLINDHVPHFGRHAGRAQKHVPPVHQAAADAGADRHVK